MHKITIPVIRGRLVRETTPVTFEGRDWRQHSGKLQIVLSAWPEFGSLRGLESHLFGYDARAQADVNNDLVIFVGSGGQLRVTTGGVLAQIAWAWGCTADDIVIDEVTHDEFPRGDAAQVLPDDRAAENSPATT